MRQGERNKKQHAISSDDDLASTKGFIRAITYILYLKDRGLLWAAPPCSSWVWVGRYQTGRSAADPGGNSAPETVKANLLVSRVVLLVMLGLLLHDVSFMAEQPLSSIMELHFRVRSFADTLGDKFRKLSMSMAAYGGDTRKPTLLYSNSPMLETICVPVSSGDFTPLQT